MVIAGVIHYDEPMSTILITGANGFVGRHLTNELRSGGHDVHGVGGPMSPGQSDASAFTEYRALDLSDSKQAADIDFAGVDAVIHLAGLAAVGPSFDDPARYVNVNAGIQINLFETALRQKAFPRMLIISSGSLFDPTSPLPLNEQSPVLPSSPYAVSKLTQEFLAKHYGGRGFECIIARPFNHIGPGQGPGFIVPDFAIQIVAAERGEQTEILVGNLEAQRDYTDVRDIARAYRLLIEQGKPGETYNICSGTARSGNEILQGLLAASTTTLSVVRDEARMRPADNPVIRGSHNKLTADTGWQPEIPFETTLADVLLDLRDR